MDLLVGCEESQAITIELRKMGHNAFSCDIEPCSGGHPEWHLQMDIFEAIKLRKWNRMILHPPCTKIAVSGNGTYGVGKEKHNERIEAVRWTQKLWDIATHVCECVAMENPVGVLNSMGNFPKPHYVQPWQFGHGEQKKTGFWLYGLEPLKPTNIVEGREQKVWKMPPSKERGKLRSKTYPGIAKAIAEQWAGKNIDTSKSNCTICDVSFSEERAGVCTCQDPENGYKRNDCPIHHWKYDNSLFEQI